MKKKIIIVIAICLCLVFLIGMVYELSTKQISSRYKLHEWLTAVNSEKSNQCKLHDVQIFDSRIMVSYELSGTSSLTGNHFSYISNMKTASDQFLESNPQYFLNDGYSIIFWFQIDKERELFWLYYDYETNMNFCIFDGLGGAQFSDFASFSFLDCLYIDDSVNIDDLSILTALPNLKYLGGKFIFDDEDLEYLAGNFSHLQLIDFQEHYFLLYREKWTDESGYFGFE